MSYSDIRNVLATMHYNGALTDGASLSSVFSITYDMSRAYVITEGVGVYLSAEQTAIAAAAQGIGDGTVVVMPVLLLHYLMHNMPLRSLTQIADFHL